jgi:hypothetical protein
MIYRPNHPVRVALRAWLSPAAWTHYFTGTFLVERSEVKARAVFERFVRERAQRCRAHIPYFFTIEPQDRGAQHVHALLRLDNGKDWPDEYDYFAHLLEQSDDLMNTWEQLPGCGHAQTRPYVLDGGAAGYIGKLPTNWFEPKVACPRLACRRAPGCMEEKPILRNLLTERRI